MAQGPAIRETKTVNSAIVRGSIITARMIHEATSKRLKIFRDKAVGSLWMNQTSVCGKRGVRFIYNVRSRPGETWLR